MTRFARAKGSKASNERREEEATPWHVMRQQLAEQLSNPELQKERNTSYNLKEILSNGDDSQKAEVWSDFGESKSNIKNQFKERIKRENSNVNCKIPEPKISYNDVPMKASSTKSNVNANKKINLGEITTVVENRGSLKKRKLIKESPYLNHVTVNKNTTETYDHVGRNKFIVEDLEKSNNVPERKIKEVDVESKLGSSEKQKFNDEKFEHASKILDVSKKKKSNKFQGKKVFLETSTKPEDNSVSFIGSTENCTSTIENTISSVESGSPQSGKKSKNNRKAPAGKSQNKIVESKLSENIPCSLNNSYDEKTSSQSEKNLNFSSIKQKNSGHSSSNKSYNNFENYDSYKNHYRTNNHSNSSYGNGFQTIIANGREIHIVKYQGFFVKKDDAEDLKKLRKKLKAQNIPKEKLETIIKLERRKAEKALAREKKKVCYHCRQFGHNFSDCPDIKESDMVKTGVCFKCGSLEHSHFECKVLQHQEFRHAVCFVCKEQGHIARQCPLNSQGLYPKGGSCHLCGEVTHLRKDCPKAVEDKTSKGVTVGTMKDNTLEDIGDASLKRKETETQKKVIKFI